MKILLVTTAALLLAAIPAAHMRAQDDRASLARVEESLRAGVENNPPAAASRPETRCGWFSNPTPANASLHDREAEWLIGVQGGHQAEGDWPSFAKGQWVETNGHYGHGCACMKVRVERDTQRVIVIESARARPLSACRRDRALRRWGFR